ncbi:MAG: hypothetical protein ACRENU_00745, partial [Gemmatimonadaceae bacterium]
MQRHRVVALVASIRARAAIEKRLHDLPVVNPEVKRRAQTGVAAERATTVNELWMRVERGDYA